jgi:hypothetical protein
MKIPNQSKKPDDFGSKEGGYREYKTVQTGFEKHFFLLYFCQSSSKHELNSCTRFKRGTHHLHHVGAKNK